MVLTLGLLSPCKESAPSKVVESNADVAPLHKRATRMSALLRNPLITFAALAATGIARLLPNFSRIMITSLMAW